MIPCPYCERGFEKRAGLMRHVTASHHSEGVVPVNPGGAIEPVVPAYPVDFDDPRLLTRDDAGELADPETYAESLDQLAPGQEPYVDPPTGDVSWEQASYTTLTPVTHVDVELANGTFIHDVPISETPLGQPFDHYTATPTSEQYTRIRALRRQGHQEAEAWMTVVGYPPPPRETPTEDARPLRLQQVAFRVREGNTDHIDATWLLRLAEIGRDAVAQLQYAVDSELLPLSWAHDDANPIVDRWNETIA